MGIYNCAKTLPAAIDSVLAQTYTNWELIMCDDGSKDNTFEVAQNYQRKYPDKIVLLKDGVVKEQGNPKELLEKDSIFKDMVQKQQESLEWNLN